jgi:acetylornithine/succinyldiaminopimelate/putrescine aminotransferase
VLWRTLSYPVHDNFQICFQFQLTALRTGNVFAVSAANVDPDRMTKAHSHTMTHLARHNSSDAAATSVHTDINDGGGGAAAAAGAAVAVRKVKRPIGVSKQEGRVVHQFTPLFGHVTTSHTSMFGQMTITRTSPFAGDHIAHSCG